VIKPTLFSLLLVLVQGSYASAGAADTHEQQQEQNRMDERLPGEAGPACNAIYYEGVPGEDGSAIRRPRCAVAASEKEAQRCNAAMNAKSLGMAALGHNAEAMGEMVFRNCWGEP